MVRLRGPALAGEENILIVVNGGGGKALSVGESAGRVTAMTPLTTNLLLLILCSSTGRCNQQPDRAAILARAARQLATIQSPITRGTATVALSRALAKGGDQAAAAKLIELLDDPYRKPSAYALLAEDAAKAGSKELSRQLFDSALKCARALQGKIEVDDLKGFVFQQIGKPQARAGDFAGAKLLADSLGTTEYRPHILAALGLAQARAGDAQASKRTFDEARVYAN